ncbi:protocatechuate 3,4-dioxygenase beta subunit [Microbacterium marinum]|uniref:alpha-amylase n=3 Tax=Bacteria TaxID=2 RepID=A0A7W7BP06_9MICO|nr:protocatechuate 3,4-dioxygenase beta subunit [Microbacterium marinum]
MMRARRSVYLRGLAALAIWSVAVTGAVLAPQAAVAETPTPDVSAQTVTVGEDGSVVVDATTGAADIDNSAAPDATIEETVPGEGDGDPVASDEDPSAPSVDAPESPSTPPANEDDATPDEVVVVEEPRGDDAPQRAGPQVAGETGISGTVTDTSGAPIEGAEVLLYPGSENDGYYTSAYTEDDGSYRIDWLEPGSYTVLVIAPDGVNLQRTWFGGVTGQADAETIELADGAHRSGIDVTLTAGARISGTVKTDKGAAVAGADVRVYEWRESSDGPRWEWVDSVSSGASGAFDFVGLPGGTYAVEVTPLDEQNLIGEWWRDAATPDAAEPIVLGDGDSATDIHMKVALGARLSGKVTDTKNAPVANASVEVYRYIPEQEWWDWEKQVTTAADGTFTVRSLPAGTYTLRFRAPTGVNLVPQYWGGSQTQSDATPIEVGAGGTVTNLSVKLQSGSQITGRILTAGGAAISGSVDVYKVVTEDDWSYNNWVDIVSTDNTGAYKVVGLPAGDYKLQFSSDEDGYATEWWDDEALERNADIITLASGATRTGVTARLSAAASISGTVLDAEGNPLEWASVNVYLVTPEGREQIVSGSTREDGTYTVGRLPAGTYAVEVPKPWDSDALGEWWSDKPTFETADRITLAAGAARTKVDFTLSTGASISGRITDDEGAPVSLAQVTLYRWSVDVENDSSYWDSIEWGEADDDGRYAFRGLERGTYTVQFRAPEGGNLLSEYWNDVAQNDDATAIDVDRGDAITDIDAVLSTGGSITGRVTGTDDAPIADIEVWVSEYDGGESSRSVITADDGSWAVNGLTPGTYRVYFDAPASTSLIDEWWDDAREYSDATSIVVEAGAAVTGIDAALAVGGSISGTVRSASGVVAGVQVEVSAKTADGFLDYRGSTLTDGTGRYTFGGLEPGNYVVSFTTDSSDNLVPEWWNNVTRSADATAIAITGATARTGIDATLAKGATLSGIVTGPDGKPVRDVWINLETSDGKWTRLSAAQTGTDGKWAARGLPAGTYLVSFETAWESPLIGEWWNDTLDRAKAAPIKVAAGATISTVNAKLAKGASLSGTVTSASGPLKTARVMTYRKTADGWTYGKDTVTDAQGRYLIEGLLPGTYAVRFDGPDGQNLVREWWNDKPTRAAADTISLTGATAKTKVDAKLSTGATISGTVTAPAGTSLGWASVSALRKLSSGWEQVGYGYVEENGSYSIAGLGAGTYTLKFQGGVPSYTSEWWKDKITEATATTFTVTAGKAHTGFDATLATPIAASRPSLTGTLKVGSPLKITPGTWQKGAALTYRWWVNGELVPGATSATYTPAGTSAGKWIAGEVTGSLAGYGTVNWFTTERGPIANGTLTAPTPTISGTPVIGSTLTAKAGTWTKGTKLAYQWFAKGKAISGATKSTYKVTSGVADKTITVRVTGSLTGYTTASKTSKATAAVLKTATPKISGTAKVGSTLTAKPGTWTSKTTFAYQWYANGKAISKATKVTYKIPKSLAGKKITVKVTGKKSGYASAAKTSAATGSIKR